ncbi:MAG: aldehyde dehydrogenase [Methanobacteriota archaeon]|nr:MAG: aldehyde dehydrogenase [Euryarchaeota archaeon]
MDVTDHALYIGGKWAPSGSGKRVDVVDPATNRPIARVASGTKEDVAAAVEAARTAFESPEWRDLDPSKRGRLLWLLGQQVRDHFDELARLESLNVGKPIREAKGDIGYVYKLFEYYAGLADKIQGETIPVPGARFDYTLRPPLGVTAHIAPWNYPLLLACRGIAPALAAGNTVVLKPATLTPLTALKLGELAGAAGFPPGVLNVITGPGREVGDALAHHPDTDSVTFTGSTETGKQLLRIVADRVVPTTLELGGKNPQIVLPDAKLDRAVRGALWGAFQNAGQMCWAGSKLLVHQDIATAFLAKLKDQTEKLRIGPGVREEVQMGPLVSREHAANVAKAIEQSASHGAKILAGGRKPDSPPYGLSAGLWTQDVGKAHAIAARLEAGMVSINEYPVTFPQTPFLGWKQSGLGLEQGIDAVLFYTHVKNVLVNLE